MPSAQFCHDKVKIYRILWTTARQYRADIDQLLQSEEMTLMEMFLCGQQTNYR